jgi:hypothetical protein
MIRSPSSTSIRKRRRRKQVGPSGKVSKLANVNDLASQFITYVDVACVTHSSGCKLLKNIFSSLVSWVKRCILLDGVVKHRVTADGLTDAD